MDSLSENLLDNVETHFNIILDTKRDLLLILKAVISTGNTSEFESLCFTGKYLNGLFRVLKNSTHLPEVTNTDNVQKDIIDNTEKIILQIKNISTLLSEDERTQLQEKYLNLSQNSLNNLQALAKDLDQIKKYLNFYKRNGQPKF